MNTAQNTIKHAKPLLIIDAYNPDMMLIPSRTFDTTSVVNRDEIKDAEIVEETTNNSSILTLGEQAMRIIFTSLREAIERQPLPDNEYELEWGPFLIIARHHYASHAEKGGDHYCGHWEQVEVIDRDDIEVIYAYNVIDDIEDAAAVKKLNDFYKNSSVKF